MNSLLRALYALMLAGALVFCGLAAVHAEEVIRSFASDVNLQTDGSVHVVETITVTAEGDKIRRGIYRDIPTELVNDDGSRLYSNLKINGVKRNGTTEPYHTEGITGGVRIYIGSADVWLQTPGVYTYTIDYSMTRMARYFADNDEIYWNATGNYWDFPIEKAVARITLPEGAAISDLQGYTGSFSSKEQAVTIEKVSDNQAIFRATRPFRPYEGMTVAASFQKGILDAPSSADSAANYLSDHRADLLPAFAVLLVFLYNLWAWFRVGRDPAKGTIIPLFHPPEGLSPALTHYIHRLGWQRSGWLAFTAGLIDLGIRGLLLLGKDGKKNTIEATGKTATRLPPEEADLLAYFADRGKVTINKSTGPALATQMSKFKKEATGKNKQNPWFRYNIGYSAVSVVLSIAVIGLMLWAGILGPEVVFITIFASVILTVIGTVIGSSLRSSGITRAIMAFWIVITVLNIGSGFLAVFSDVLQYVTADLAAIAVGSILVLNVLFGMIMRAPTVEGRRIMDQIDGFKMYLETAEKERLNFEAEPEMTVSRFESILPYAIALGVEKPWTDRFENDLARNAVSDYEGTVYHPHWYSGSDFSSGSMSRNVAAFATGMSAAMIAAQPSSSSSSGSSGGGSSGGGGGGGGGGGW